MKIVVTGEVVLAAAGFGQLTQGLGGLTGHEF